MNKIKHIFDLLELGMVQFKQKFYTIITVLIRAHFRVHSAAHIRLLKHILKTIILNVLKINILIADSIFTMILISEWV